MPDLSSRSVPRLLRQCLSVLVLCSLSTPSFADAIVLKSTVKRYEAGEWLQADETLRLRAQQSVILISADGETITLHGPVNYTIPSTPRDANDFILTISALFAASKDEIRLGGVRSDALVACELPSPDATWLEMANLWDRGCHHDALAAFEVARIQQVLLPVPRVNAAEPRQKMLSQ